MPFPAGIIADSYLPPFISDIQVIEKQQFSTAATVSPTFTFTNSPQMNDLIIFVASEAYSATVTIPSGWLTPLSGMAKHIGVSNIAASIPLYYVVTAGQAGALTWTLSNLVTSATPLVVSVALIRNAYTTDPFDLFNWTSNWTPGTSHTLAPLPGSMLPSNSLVLERISSDDSLTYSGIPTGFTTLYNTNPVNGTAFLQATSRTVAGTSIAGSLTASISDEYSAVAFAIRPLAAGKKPPSSDITVVSTVDIEGTSTSGATFIPTKPDAIMVGDIWIICIETANEGVTILPNGGTWNTAISQLGTGTAGTPGAHAITLIWSRYDGVQGSPSLNSTAHLYTASICLRNCQPSGDPLDARSYSTNSSGGSILSLTTGLNTATDKCMTLTFVSTGVPNSANISTFACPGLVNPSKLIDNSLGTSSNGGSISVFSGIKTPIGSVGSLSINQTSAPPSVVWLSIAIRPTSSFNPTHLVGLHQWYDPSNDKTVTYGTGITLAQVNDVSFNKFNVTATGTDRPDRLLGGLRASLYNIDSADNEIMKTTGAGGVNQKPLTAFAVLKHDGRLTDRVFYGTDQTGGWVWQLGNDNTQMVSKYATAVIAKSTSVVPVNETVILAHSYSSASELRFYMNNILDGVATSAQTFTAATTTTTICNSSGQTFWGPIGELIKYNRVLTDQEQEQIHSYLKTKWGVSFSPKHIPGLQAWYDAADASTFTYSSGNVVSQWNDKSSGALHISQGTVANRPTRSGIQNGQATVVFDVTDALGRAGTSICPSALTIFAVFKKVGNSSTYESFPVTLTASNLARPFDAYNEVRFLGNTNPLTSYTPVAQSTEWTMTSISATSSGAMSEWRNGIPIGPVSTSGAFSVSSQYLGIASRQDRVTQFTGEIAEIIIYDTVLSSTNRKYVEDYLSTKWALPVGTYVPTQLSNLSLWLDASDPTSFVYSTGNTVAQWRDKSGNDRHFLQNTFANQPTRNGIQNGRSTVVFNGSTNSLIFYSPISKLVNNTTMFVACKRTGGDASWSVPFINGNAYNGYGIALRAGGSTLGVLFGGMYWHTTSTPDPAAAGVYSLRCAEPQTWELRKDSTAVPLSGQGFPLAGTSAMIPSTFHQFAGEVYEIIFYDAPLSDTDRLLVENYLKNKWGIA